MYIIYCTTLLYVILAHLRACTTRRERGLMKEKDTDLVEIQIPSYRISSLTGLVYRVLRRQD